MKIITAMVQRFMLNKIVDALEAMEGFPGMTLSDVRGFGSRRSPREERSWHLDDFHQKVRIEIVAPDEMVESITNALVANAHTGNDGDGKVFVWTVEHAIRIQTGEEDEQAI